ncbi:MAG: glycosyltransferase family 2 protein [Novosphingobium sp.]|nr:glycosyltransferase family 2 protein [Novosphingobium sp.]MCP5401606.1 glycosyltransferase family 2 protein [Novosphingobium sp.]
MECSVVIRSLNEADRLRLTLTSLACQTRAPEVVVVDDGSSDHTVEVVESFRDRLRLTPIRHSTPQGRSAAANAGARAASGDVLVVLDGDTLMHPQCVERHLAAHEADPSLLGRGETWHIRSTRFLLDPEGATPRAGEESRLEAMSPAEREKLRITRRQIEEDFAGIERRATPGIYPGIGPRALYELEVDALRNHPECSMLWAAASGSNFSVARDAFLASGGFDGEIDINEHRELALRLCDGGARIGLVEGARTYHLTHRSGWRDPLAETNWETVFYRRHPSLAVKLLSVFWASLSRVGDIPAEARITTFPDLERFAQGESGIDFDAVRRRIPGLPELGAVQ